MKFSDSQTYGYTKAFINTGDRKLLPPIETKTKLI